MKKFFAIMVSVFMLHQYAVSQTCGTTNIALTKSTSASSYADEFSQSSMAVDGNANAPWKSDNNANQWLIIDLGQSYSICQVKLSWPELYYFAASYALYISEDNTNWTAFGAAVTNGNGDIDIISASGVGRYVKLSCTEKGISWADRYELKEFEVYAGVTPPTNNPPSVSITAPSNNSSVTQGNSIIINADATDSDGSITKVEFYQGATLLGEDNSHPYSYTWNNAAAGTYSITAKAYDDDGATTTSSAISVTVNSSSANGWSITANGDVTTNSKVLIKTSVAPSAEGESADFAVNGNIWAKKLKITQLNWADFVFDSGYKLMSLEEVEKYINKHKHLPGVPSAKEVEKNGISVGDNQAILLQKIEELTLYLIEQEKRIKQLENQLKAAKK